MSGKITPPTEPPVQAMPVAVPRLVMKKWPMAVVAGVTMRDVPMPFVLTWRRALAPLEGDSSRCNGCL